MIVTTQNLDGLRVSLLQMPKANTVGAVLLIGAGAADDQAPAFGAAHLAEHVRIAAGPSGPASMPPVRGTTGNVTTRFSAVGLPEDAPALAAHLAGLLGSAKVPSETFEAERQAAMIEVRHTSSSPLLSLGPAVAAAAAPGHALAATVRADASSLARLTPLQVQNFTDRHYRRSCAELVLSGPELPNDEVLQVVDSAARSVRDCPPIHPAADGFCGAGRTGAAGHATYGEETVGLSPELDGLVLLSLIRGPVMTDHAAALIGPGGVVEAAGARLGHQVTGRSAVSGRTLSVEVLCWRAGADAGVLASALTAKSDELWSAAAAPGTLVRAAVRRRQESAYRARTPLGAAAALLDHEHDGDAAAADLVTPPPVVPTPSALKTMGVWRVHRGTLVRHG